MAPQQEIPVAANVLGVSKFEGEVVVNSAESIPVFWCIQLIPQIWHNWWRKETEGFPGLMIFLWAACAPPFGAYAVVQNFNVPLQIQPQIFGALALICWTQTLIYHNGWSIWKASSMALTLFIVFGGIEAALILGLRGPYEHGMSWPIMVVGIIAATLLALGLIPPYFELGRRNGRVIGINFLFLAIDWNGAFFSLLSLVVQHSFDIIGGICYIVCILLESGIFISHFIWLFRTRRLRAEAQRAGKTFDEYSPGLEESRPTSASPEVAANRRPLKD